MDERPRDLTDSELSVFRRLLKWNFPGRDALRLQLEGLKVRQLDESGCLALEPTAKVPAHVEHRIPIEGSFPDSDGVLTHVDLHVVDGLLFGLEYYKEDGSAVVRHPPAESIELFSPTGESD